MGTIPFLERDFMDSSDKERKGIDQRDDPKEREDVPIFKKLKELSTAEKVKLAITGDKELRGYLIREPVRSVQVAVINNPRITAMEVERIACLRTVDEEVLRLIGQDRQFLRTYGVKRALANNPRTPLRIAMALVPYLTKRDLKVLSDNKNIPNVLKFHAKKYLLSHQR
jgi:hypothetical protein